MEKSPDACVDPEVTPGPNDLGAYMNPYEILGIKFSDVRVICEILKQWFFL